MFSDDFVFIWRNIDYASIFYFCYFTSPYEFHIIMSFCTVWIGQPFSRWIGCILVNLTACGSSCRKQCIPLLLRPLSRRYFFNLCQFQISIKLIIDNQNSIMWWCHCYVLSGIILIVRWISTVERRLLNLWFYMAFRCNFLHVYFDNRAT